MTKNHWITDGNNVVGLNCPYHGGKVLFTRGFPNEKLEELCCPTCGQPICPECAYMDGEAPDTETLAIEFLRSAQQGRGMAYCGGCGEYGIPWLIRYLKMVECPVPANVNTYRTPPSGCNLVMTTRVSLLPDASSLADDAMQKFFSGVRGIIVMEHIGGDIWAISERLGDKWQLTLCYPEER